MRVRVTEFAVVFSSSRVSARSYIGDVPRLLALARFAEEFIELRRRDGRAASLLSGEHENFSKSYTINILYMLRVCVS